MNTIDISLKYPIGLMPTTNDIDANTLNQHINDIIKFPEQLEKAIDGITKEQLNWLYRPEGWSIKQVIHHCADSHMNAITRFKLALTEDHPTIKPYLEANWALLSDANNDDIDHSLMILKGLHARWGQLLRSLSPTDLKRTYHHPEHNKSFNLRYTITMYGWHCNHHLAHVKQALRYKNNFN